MMAKLKKAAAVAVMVGGMVLSGGVAHGGDHIGNFCTVIGPDSGDDRGQDNPSDVIVDNLQGVKCNQDFELGTRPLLDN
ncbi:hypothetical protein [Streptomyces sp. ALI-76-A]|uniref:hypothetical protein n=1 Tax=Streptomyces sp. ALI-76-A TaxID=3025736 RepID=UPI00256F52FC|nr:hypothetical protein [Streptomyces sp. ALI-76-A]MDL5206389.1 hypothetical protein [Streptomyces sp. ALI-76-A]